jgi:DNA polymerase (family 10)
MLELEGDDAYRIRAYRKAAESVSSLVGDVNEYHREGRLRDIPGVGSGISGVIAELLSMGTSGLHEALKKETPPELHEVMEVPGIGRRTAIKVYKALGARTIDDFRRAAKSRRIRHIRGLGESSERRILESIERYRRIRGEVQIPIYRARAIAADLMGYFEGCEGLERADVVGTVRRWKALVGDVNVIAAAGDASRAIDCFCSTPVSQAVKDRGNSHARVITRYRVDATLEAVGAEDYGLHLVFGTGSREHLDQLIRYAGSQGVRLGHDGYYVDGERRTFQTEEGLYQSLGLEHIPPELREGAGEIEAASTGTLPELIDLKGIRGDLHTHTAWSDGANTIQEMAMAARARGYEYIAICDHSRSLQIANGLSTERLRDQMAEIDEINDTLEDFTVLKGSEVDILPDGSLDLPDDVLKDLDVVLGSVHVGMRQDPDVITRRVLNALENEHLTVLAHPTSRIIGRREPTGLDIDRVIEAALDHDKVLEVNAYPDRLDLSDENVRKAMDAGAMICIDTDAHSAQELGFMEYGVHNARRGWATRARTLNTLSTEALLEFLERA